MTEGVSNSKVGKSLQSMSSRVKHVTDADTSPSVVFAEADAEECKENKSLQEKDDGNGNQ